MFLPGVASSPYNNPQTPGSSFDSSVSSHLIDTEWHSTDMEVRIRQTYPDHKLAGLQGVITGISVSR